MRFKKDCFNLVKKAFKANPLEQVIRFFQQENESENQDCKDIMIIQNAKTFTARSANCVPARFDPKDQSYHCPRGLELLNRSIRYIWSGLSGEYRACKFNGTIPREYASPKPLDQDEDTNRSAPENDVPDSENKKSRNL